MGSKGINIVEECHVVNILPPLDIDAAAQTSDYFSMAKYQHASIIIQLGVTGAASTITVEESDDNAGSNTTAIAFSYWKEETAGGDTLSTKQAATTAGFATSTNDGIFYVIEIDASQLSDGFPYLVVKSTDPGAATFGSMVAVLSGNRYSEDVTPTAIT
jgi:hypothetical protein